jgi:TRAP-type C4-dicarboxylate transport system substrate-binding protein
MSRIIFTALLFLLASCQDPVQYDVHVAWPEDNFHTQGVKSFAKKLEDKTNGKVQWNVHAGGKLGIQDNSVLDVVASGRVPVAEVLMGNVVQSAPIFGLSSIPRMAGSYNHAWSLYLANKTYYQARLRERGIILLYVSPWPPSGLFTKKAIAEPGDFSTLRTRTYDSNSASFVKNFGAKGVAIPFGNLIESLQSGVIDSVLTSAVTGADIDIWKYTNVFTEINYAYPLNMVIMNAEAFEKLTPAVQEDILEIAREVEQQQWKSSRTSHHQALKKLKSHGMKVISGLQPSVRKALNEAARKIRDRWIISLKKGTYSLDIYGESD